ncbi:MAG: hypothetical protein RL291_687 [Pseudomonadota bacterium]|jgi:hypothetical protein
MSDRLTPNDYIAKIKARARLTGDAGRVTRHQVRLAVVGGCVVETMLAIDPDHVSGATRVARLPRYSHWRYLTDGALALRSDGTLSDAEREALDDLVMLIVDACSIVGLETPAHAMVLRGTPPRDHFGNVLEAPAIILVPAGPIETAEAETQAKETHADGA